MHGPTCIFWANLTPLSLQLKARGLDKEGIEWQLQARLREAEEADKAAADAPRLAAGAGLDEGLLPLFLPHSRLYGESL
jgi:hypothetical protein